jgi:lysyl-tRNA synthetase class 1
MDEHLPSTVRAVFDRYETSREPFHEHELAATIQNAASPADALTAEERRAVWLEISAFYFMATNRSGDSIWGTYFAPMMSGTTKEGVEVHTPDITREDASAIAYWASRSDEVRHPILRARYADLVWDFTKLVAKRRPDVTFARAAIDAYVEAIENQIYFHDSQAEDFAGRALSIALSINDKVRVQQVKSVFFTLDAAIGDVEKRGLWSMLFDNLYDLPGVGLTDPERQNIIDKLEHVLQVTTQRGQAQFEPWFAQGAAERLERHYRRVGQMADVHRVVRACGQAFESAANDANAMLAVAWLQPVFDKYHDVGMGEDARRVHQVLEKRGLEAQAGIQRVEIPLRIDPADVDRFADALTNGDLEEALKRIGMKFIPQADEVRSLNERMKTDAPLMLRIAITRYEAGHPAGITGPQDEDADGRLIHQMANQIGLEAIWLAASFEKLVRRYGATAEQIMDALSASPVFANARRSILVSGLSAWLSQDYIQAIHVLMPQAEHAVRTMASLSGVPITARGYTRGVMQTRGLGEILHDKLFRQLIDENVRLYLLAFLADPRGINLRNRVAHGLLEHEQMERVLTDRLVQVLFALSCLVLKEESIE